MANVLTKDKQIAIIAALAEGSSLRAVTRITGIHRTTIMNLARFACWAGMRPLA
jgi:lambda repressor-like predicted transcriptional regulator